MSALPSLRTLSLRGGLYTAGRQLSGMAISFAGLATLIRLIGPAGYGVYVAAFALYGYAFIFLGLGCDVYLMRKPGEPSEADLHQASALMLATGLAGAALAVPASRLAAAWIGDPRIAPVLRGLFACLPLQLATLVPSAMLQRRMDYRWLAQAELAGMLGFYGAALPLAVLGAGVAAPVAGLWAQQATAAMLLLRRSGYRPRLCWDRKRVRAMFAFGLRLTLATGMWHARFLVNPLIVARVLGPEAAATVGIGLRIVEALSFMRTVAWRVAIPAMGRVQRQPARLIAAIEDGTRLQLLVTGPVMLAFSLLAPWLIPLALGRDLAPMLTLFPFLALAYLINSVFCLHFPALHVIGRNTEVAGVHLLHVVLLCAAAALLVPACGLIGYGYAEMVAMGGYGLAQACVRRHVGPVRTALGLAWAGAFAAPLFVGALGPWSWAGPALALGLPASRRALSITWTQLRALAR